MAIDHQYIEEKLLFEDTLTPEETLRLQEHLRSCETCQRLSIAWGEVEGQLQRTKTVSPAPGFTRRWEARLAVERARVHQRQTSLIFALSLGGALLSLLVVGLMLLPLIQSPLPFVSIWAYQLIRLFYYAGSVGEAFETIFQTIFKFMPPTRWAAICVALGSLCVLWMVTLRKLTSPRRVIL